MANSFLGTLVISVGIVFADQHRKIARMKKVVLLTNRSITEEEAKQAVKDFAYLNVRFQAYELQISWTPESIMLDLGTVAHLEPSEYLAPKVKTVGVRVAHKV